MAKDSELGRAVVPIRADLKDLDKDLGEAQSRFEGVLGSIGKGAGIALGGIVGAGGAAVGVLGALAAEAAPIEGIANAFAGVSGNAEGMLAALREGSAGMATDADLMKSYNEAAQLVSKTFADQMPDAMGYLGKVAAATGQDMGYMIDSLVKGVGRLSGPILDNLGIQVNLTDAVALWAQESGLAATKTINNSQAMNDMGIKIRETAAALAVATQKQAEFTDKTSESARMAKQLQIDKLTQDLEDYKMELEGLEMHHGETIEDFDALTESMTKAQQQEAMMMLTMQKLAENTADMPDVTENASTKMAQFGTTMENLKAEIGMAFLPILSNVMTVFGDIASEYGPQLADMFGRLAELVGPLLGAAFETLVPAVMQLLDTLIPLAETIMEQLFPAFTAIIEAIVPLAAVLLEALGPAFTALIGAVLPVITALVEMLAPILADIIGTLLPVLIPLVLLVADTFVGLLFALMPVVEMLLGSLVPVLLDLVVAILPPLTAILAVVIAIFMDLIELVLPVFVGLLEVIMPIITALAELIGAGLNLALKALATLIDKTIKPALRTFIEFILQPIKNLFQGISEAIQGVINWISNLATSVGKLNLPDWLTPGSPTPLELGLRGIASELARVDRMMGGLNATMTMQTVGAGVGRTSQWYGDLIIQGSADPQATAAAVIRAMQDRGMMSSALLR